MSKLAFIVDCYKNLLGRAPDQEGVDSLLASGASEEAIRQSFLTSPERRTLEEAIDATRGRIRDNGAQRNYLLASAFGNGNLGDFAFPAIVAPALERVSGGAIFAHSVSDVAAFPFAAERVIPTSFQPMNPIVLRLFDGLIIGPGGLLAWPHWPIWDPGWTELIPIPYAIYACGVEAPLPVDLRKLVRGARWASGRDEASVAALRSANPESTLCPDPILSLYEPGHTRVDQPTGRAFIVRGPTRPEHNQLAAELLPDDAVIGLEPDVDAPLCALFPALRFVDSLDALSEVLASRRLIVSERYHGAVVGLLLGKEVHGWVRADHNASKIQELYRSLDIPHFCNDRLLLGTTAEFPSEQVSARLTAIRDTYSPVSRRMIEALERARPEETRAERVDPSPKKTGSLSPQLRDYLSALPSLSVERGSAARVPCKMCSGPTRHFASVDFQKHCGQDPYRFGRSGLCVDYLRCEACEFIFTTFFDTWSTKDFATFVYNADYVKVDPEYVSARPERTALHMTHALAGGEQARMLDYGSGTGAFAKGMLKAGFAVFDNYDPFSSPERPIGTYDVITAFEVLEHSPDPHGTISDMLGYLRPGGCLLIGQTLQPQDIEELKGDWWYLGPRNGHVSTFSTTTLQTYAAAHDLRYCEGNHIFAFSRRELSDLSRTILKRIEKPRHVVNVAAPAEDGAHHTGWHGPERDNDIVFRWTCDPEVPFGLHRFAAGATTVTVPLYMVISDAFLSACRLRAGEMESRAAVGAKVLTFSVSFPEATVAPLILVTPSPIVPFQRDGTPDMRPLGVAVRCMA